MQLFSALVVALANTAQVSASWAAIEDTGVVRGYSKVFQQTPPVSIPYYPSPVVHESGQTAHSCSGPSCVHGRQYGQLERPGTQQGYVVLRSFFLSFRLVFFLFSSCFLSAKAGYVLTLTYGTGKYNGPVWQYSGSFEGYMQRLNRGEITGTPTFPNSTVALGNSSVSSNTTLHGRQSGGYWLPSLAPLGKVCVMIT